MSEENYVFKENEVRAYATACLRIAEALNTIDPQALICPLRGSLPPTTIVLKLLGKTPNHVVTIPTSNYVANRDELLRTALYDLVGNVVDNNETLEGKVKIFTVDTAISGTSTKHFMDVLKRFIPEVQEHYGVGIDYYLVKLWQRDQEVVQKKSTDFYSNTRNVVINQGVVYVPNLLCEDKDGLLGYRYGFTERRGVKTSELIEVDDRRLIIVDRESQEPLIFMGKKASDLFKDVVLHYAYNIREQAKLFQKALAS